RLQIPLQPIRPCCPYGTCQSYRNSKRHCKKKVARTEFFFLILLIHPDCPTFGPDDKRTLGLQPDTRGAILFAFVQDGKPEQGVSPTFEFCKPGIVTSNGTGEFQKPRAELARHPRSPVLDPYRSEGSGRSSLHVRAPSSSSICRRRTERRSPWRQTARASS